MRAGEWLIEKYGVRRHGHVVKSRMVRLLAGTGLALAIGCGTAHAQNVNSGVGLGPSTEVNRPGTPPPAPAGGTPPVEHLFGDWGGIRTRLDNLGIDTTLDFYSEFASNVAGGVKQGSTFANQIGFETDIDWQKLAGITGLSTHIIMVNRSGSSDSALFGDNLLPVQEIYGSGGDVVVHLVSAYGQEKLAGGMVDVAAGRMNVENDFASSPLYCEYMNNMLCGDPKSLPGGDVGHSAYPDAVWAARLRVRSGPEFYIESGAYEANRGLYNYGSDRTGFKLDTSQDSGVYLPVEVGYEPTLGHDALPGHYKLGFGYDTSQFGMFTPTQSPGGLPGSTTYTHRGNTQVWALADQMLLRHSKGDQSGLIALAGFVHNDPQNSSYAEQYFVGLLDKGFWAARPDDGVGMLFSYDTVSGQLGKVEALEQEFGLPFSSGSTGVQTHEMVLEVNYQLHVYHGVNLNPEFQYVFRPNAQSNIHDAAVFGFKSHISF